MLPNKAHVEIDGISLRIAEQVEGHYVHEWKAPFNQRTDISGAPGKQQLFPDRLLWTFDDWSGGEGNNIYYPDEPTIYRYSTALNPRIPGQLTGRPTRSTASITSQADTIISATHRFAVGGGALWFGMHDDTSPGSDNIWLYYSENGTTWNLVADADVGGLNFLDSMYGTADHIYYASRLGNSGADIYRNSRDRDTGTISAEQYVYNSSLSNEYALSMLVRGSEIYFASFGKLYRVDYDGVSTATTETLLDSTSDVSASGLYRVFSNLIAADQSLIYFNSVDGNSIIRDYTDGAGGDFWVPPPSFTITDIAFHHGVVWICGYWGSPDNNGRGALWGIPMSTRTPTLVHEFRANLNQSVRPLSMSAAPRDQLVIGCEDGKVFIYDISADAMSLLDDLEGTYQFGSGDEDFICVGVFGDRRYAVVTDPSRVDNHQIISWSADEESDRSVTLADQILEMPDWDYDFPHQLKKLMGFHITMDPLVTNQTVTISYSNDSGTSYTALPAITSATAGNSTGRFYQAVSSPSLDYNFYHLRYKVEVESSGGALTPVVHAITAESRLVPTVQSWKLAVLVTDEPNNQRISSGDRTGVQIRDALYTTKNTADVVLFKDGYRHGEKLESTSYNVLVKDVSDVITQNGQGYMALELEEVPT